MTARGFGAALIALAIFGCSDGPTPPPPIACVPGSADGVQLSLAPGGVQVMSGAETLACMQVPGSASATEYVVIPANADSITDVLGRFRTSLATVNAAALSAARSVSARPAAGAPSAMLGLGLSDMGSTHIERETRFRAAERATLASIAARRFDDPAPDQHGASRSLSAAVAAACTSVPAVDDICTLKVPDADALNLCQTYFTVVVRIKAVGTRSVIAEDTTTAQTGGFTAADYEAIKTEFDEEIFRWDTLYFGAPSDLDANDRIFILYTPEVNKLTERGSEGKFGGFFFGGDLFPVSSCAQSNVGEIFYLLAPDPLSRYGDARLPAEVREETRGTIAHEFQHMINLGVRMENPSPTAEILEEPWLNEALSHMAEELVGRRITGKTDTGNYTFDDVADEANGYRNFNAFFYQNFARFRFWQVRPDTSSATSGRADRQLAYRGAAWALVRYAADQYSGGNVPNFTRALVRGGPEADVSVANLVRRSGVPFDTLMAGWMVANYADDAGIAGLAPKYTYTSWNMRDVATNLNRIQHGSDTFPLLVRPLDATGLTLNVRSASGAYFRLGGSSGLPASSISMTATTGAPVTFRGARAYVLRTQ